MTASCGGFVQVVGDDWKFKGKGANSSGDSFGAAPNIDHTAEVVKSGLSEWLRWMRSEIGFDGWRCAPHPHTYSFTSSRFTMYFVSPVIEPDCYSRCLEMLQIWQDVKHRELALS